MITAGSLIQAYFIHMNEKFISKENLFLALTRSNFAQEEDAKLKFFLSEIQRLSQPAAGYMDNIIHGYIPQINSEIARHQRMKDKEDEDRRHLEKLFWKQVAIVVTIIVFIVGLIATCQRVP